MIPIKVLLLALSLLLAAACTSCSCSQNSPRDDARQRSCDADGGNVAGKPVEMTPVRPPERAGYRLDTRSEGDVMNLYSKGVQGPFTVDVVQEYILPSERHGVVLIDGTGLWALVLVCKTVQNGEITLAADDSSGQIGAWLVGPAEDLEGVLVVSRRAVSRTAGRSVPRSDHFIQLAGPVTVEFRYGHFWSVFLPGSFRFEGTKDNRIPRFVVRAVQTLGPVPWRGEDDEGSSGDADLAQGERRRIAEGVHPPVPEFYITNDDLKGGQSLDWSRLPVAFLDVKITRYWMPEKPLIDTGPWP
jgi:hypothetical protein